MPSLPISPSRPSSRSRSKASDALQLLNNASEAPITPGRRYRSFLMPIYLYSVLRAGRPHRTLWPVGGSRSFGRAAEDGLSSRVVRYGLPAAHGLSGERQKTGRDAASYVIACRRLTVFRKDGRRRAGHSRHTSILPLPRRFPPRLRTYEEKNKFLFFQLTFSKHGFILFCRKITAIRK